MAKREHGEDAFGQFWIESGWCGKCDFNCAVTVQYRPIAFELPYGIQVEKTILKSPSRKLGVDCGCYGKFHRQVAHIEDNMRVRANGEVTGKEA